MASGGTLFLDEIGDMGMKVQAKLLRTLEGPQFERLGSPKPIQTDVRLIAATNRHLKKMVEEKKFSTDDQIVSFLIGDTGIDIEDLEKRWVREAMAVAN